MATANDMIRRAMRLVGAIAEGSAMTTAEATDGLAALNSMLDSWAVERLPVYAVRRVSFSPTGATSYTIGTGGVINTTRPNDIYSATWRFNSIDYFIEPTGQKQWDQIAFKDVNNTIPELFYYEKTYPLGKVYFYPQPSGGTMELQTSELLQSFTSLTDALTLPPGYQRAIEFNLAPELAAEYSMPVPESVARIAVESKAAIMSANITPLFVELPPITRGSVYNIYSDT